MMSCPNFQDILFSFPQIDHVSNFPIFSFVKMKIYYNLKIGYGRHDPFFASQNKRYYYNYLETIK